ncbi:hypothetical protein ASH04_12190 [Rhodococcus sp. Leaf233]|nr:hypothetical protein ASH04_12190 [Rhodococcus sp. Leaf233]
MNFESPSGPGLDAQAPKTNAAVRTIGAIVATERRVVFVNWFLQRAVTFSGGMRVTLSEKTAVEV